ncbi:hypothetical protein [Methanobrevibacter millerae]|uniref:Uncharacterized protein n=1 Tax=Methanobrevibacter millerae TaxID=230361 RepID=A0A1G5VD89_9EURY|nr:hypothetical protein [Methanobrevibacter millerae]SDA42995.1 hypothetical protein SAMN02910315_00492 [Methanobrevibacter millerae]
MNEQEFNVPTKEGIRISSNSKVVNISHVGVGGSDDEIMIIPVNKKLKNNEQGDLEIIYESDMQIILNKKTATELKKLLDKYI